MIYSVISELGFAGLALFIFVLSLFAPSIQVPKLPPAFPAKRVVMLDNGLSSYITINQGIAHVTAISQFAGADLSSSMVERIYPGARQLPVVGAIWEPDLETLLLLRADAVISWFSFAEAAREMNYPGVIEDWIDENDPIHAREHSWRVLGRVAGQEARVEYLLKKWAAQRAAIQAAVPRDPSHRVKVGWIWLYQGAWSVLSDQQWNPYRLESAGAQNVGKTFSYEELLRAAPDVILFASDPGDPTVMSDIVRLPELRVLRAVRENRFYKVPSHAVTNEAFEDLTLLTWMAEVFYPDIKLPRLRDEYKREYWDVYHYAISDDEIDRLINLKENSQSAGYQRFSRQAGMQ
jgi:iron complex transport system substrate-binding protein